MRDIFLWKNILLSLTYLQTSPPPNFPKTPKTNNSETVTNTKGAVRHTCNEEGGWGADGAHWVGGRTDVAALLLSCHPGEHQHAIWFDLCGGSLKRLSPSPEPNNQNYCKHIIFSVQYIVYLCVGAKVTYSSNPFSISVYLVEIDILINKQSFFTYFWIYIFIQAVNRLIFACKKFFKVHKSLFIGLFLAPNQSLSYFFL